MSERPRSMLMSGIHPPSCWGAAFHLDRHLLPSRCAIDLSATHLTWRFNSEFLISLGLQQEPSRLEPPAGNYTSLVHLLIFPSAACLGCNRRQSRLEYRIGN